VNKITTHHQHSVFHSVGKVTSKADFGVILFPTEELASDSLKTKELHENMYRSQ